MSPYIMNKEQKISKTQRALYDAMYSLLKNTSFAKMTIKGICEEALISRAAFYAHFIDKYDLLKQWLIAFWPKDIEINNSYEELEKKLNVHVRENAVILRNLLYNADNETLELLFDFILSTINLTVEKDDTGRMNPREVVLSNFFAGGLISYLMWQVDNRFPPDVPLINRNIYEMIKCFKDLQTK